MQKSNWHILSTRTLPEALLTEAATHNICIDIVPFIETKAVIDDATAAHISQLFQKPITAVFTSTNAVTAVADIGKPITHWKLYSIGNTTARTSNELFQIPIAGTANDAAQLADVIIKDDVKEVVFFCGDLRRDTLPEKLKHANITVQEIVVYQTIEVPKLIATTYDAVLFFSPSAVRSYFSVNKLCAATAVFAIGATTADAIKPFTDQEIYIAQKPDAETLVQQAIQHLNTKKQETE